MALAFASAMPNILETLARVAREKLIGILSSYSILLVGYGDLGTNLNLGDFL
jgi:hypothetical protein